MELFEESNTFHQIISFLDQDHKFLIRNENDYKFLILEPATENKMFNVKFVTNEQDISSSKPISKHYIPTIAYYLGFRFESCVLEDRIPI
jgi:hypothetical protein